MNGCLELARREAHALAVFVSRETVTPHDGLHRLADDWRRIHGLPSVNLPWQHLPVPFTRSLAAAQAHAALPTERSEASVEAIVAYNELEHQVAQQIALLATLGLTVEYVDEPEPYATATDQANDVTVNGRIRIATIAIHPDHHHPLLGNERGGSYDQFRAVHDIFGHVAIGTGFDRHGEFAAWLHHSTMFFGPAQRAATTELHGENSVLAVTGTPARHAAGILPTVFSPTPFFHQR